MDIPVRGAAPQQPALPPGFRFHPTDEELLVHYLRRKVSSTPIPVPIVAEIDFYKFDPWDLPAKASFGEREWYFFSPRDRKYPNGTRPNRAAASGYWKATGTDKPILTFAGTQKIGVKKALVFYRGRPPKGLKTNWIMHEYRLTDGAPRPSAFAARKSLRLDDWVLCRVYMRSNHSQRPVGGDREYSSCFEEALPSLPVTEDSKLNILPGMASIASEPDTELDSLFDSIFTGANPEADLSCLAGKESSQPAYDANSLSLINPSLIPQSASIVPSAFFPKLKSIETDTSKLGIASLKRGALEPVNAQEQLAKNSFIFSNPPQLAWRLLPPQQQGDMGTCLRFPFSDGRQRY